MIAVVITTFSAPAETLAACVRSVVAGGVADLVLVVDNGGRAVLPPDAGGLVRLLRQPINRGFGAAANVGFAEALAAGASAIALLNDDVVVEPGWLAELATGLRPDDQGGPVGAVQPKLLYAGTEPAVVNSLGVRLDRCGAGHDIGEGELDGDWAAGACPIEMFTAGAVLFDAEFLTATGGFDERFFMYYEDVDLALRGARLGWTYRSQPAAVVWHHGGVSARTLGDRRAFYLERNRLWCVWRHGDRRMIAAGLWLSVRRVRFRPRWAHLCGLLAGMSGVRCRELTKERKFPTPRG